MAHDDVDERVSVDQQVKFYDVGDTVRHAGVLYRLTPDGWVVVDEPKPKESA